MEKLYEKLKDYKIEDAIKCEESDRQFIAIKKLWEKYQDKEVFLALIIWNSLVCYQLSWKWEDYWEEFSKYFSEKIVNYDNLIEELGKFLQISKNNSRFWKTKIERLEKYKSFLETFRGNWEYYYKKMSELAYDLSLVMRQKQDAKTITFAVKMFSYWARNIYPFRKFDFDIFIPIDSRLRNLYQIYNQNYKDIKKFYFDLSEKLDIPMLHLDAILWTKYDELIVGEV